MEIHQVRYFLAVAETLNFTRAAAACNVAQPSLTRAIKLLEDELGGPLFHRERANTHLTELGRMVEPHLRSVLEQASAAKNIARDFKSVKKTKLKLGVMCTIAPSQFVELVAHVQQRHPDVELEIVDANAHELRRRLLADELEVAIHCIPRAATDERLHALPLYSEQMVIVVDREHPFAKKNAIRLADLDGMNYLSRANCEFGGAVDDIFDAQGVDWNKVYASERDDWIQAMIASGMGFGFMPQYLVAHPAVVARPLVDPELHRQVDLATVRGRPHSPAVGALVRAATQIKWHGAPALAVQMRASA